MERKILVCMVSLLLIFCSTVMAVDTCEKLHDKYQICLEKEAEGRSMDYDYCQTALIQPLCDGRIGHICYWNSTTNTCQTDLALSDSTFDGKVNLSDLVIMKQEFLRTDGPIYTSGPPLVCYSASAPVPKTGQTTSYATGDDGDLEKGVAWPNPRFTDNGDGTVTDNLTGLIWLKIANCFGTRTWDQALSDCNGLNSGECGLMDGSSAGHWRLPHLFELESLRDMKYQGPCISDTTGTEQWSEGDPFNNVQNNYYWSSTTAVHSSAAAWQVHYYDGIEVVHLTKGEPFYVWPVRGPK